MNSFHLQAHTHGFGRWELLICIVVAILLTGIILPQLRRSRPVQRDHCVSNLKQIGLAFRMWANDHEDRLPMEVSTLNGNRGTKEFNLTGEVWRHFVALSNELVSAKVLACPNDERRSASDWQSIKDNSCLSYFAGLDANETNPQSILSGDRNLTGTAKLTNGVLHMTAADQVEWTKDIHNQRGNIALRDGSAHQMTPGILAKQFQAVFQSTTQTVHRLALPQ